MEANELLQAKIECHIDFQQVLKALIALNKENRRKFKEYESFYSAPDFVSQFGIVSLDIGRAVGKSYFIKTNAQPGDLVLTYSLEDVRFWNRSYINIVVMCPKIHTVRFGNYGQRYNTIWIDEPHLTLKEISLYDVLKEFIKDCGQTVIMLGK